MKKTLMIMAAAVVVSTSAFAEIPAFQLSAGAGALLDVGIYNGKISGTKIYSHSTVGFGGYAFLDATFAEFSLGISGGPSTIKINTLGTDKGTYSALNIGLLGKYPFALGRITAFPLLGIDYQIFLALKDSSGTKADDAAKDYSALWFKFGGGADFDLTDSIYLRGEFLYGLRTKNKVERDDSLKGVGNGPSIRLGVGYRF
ncbi:MAG: outer membrane beta-barrel protein [Treponema sp.]|jgi:opacity protein-like surface antigen|nr:outer membrane beta-barrel protein [Treponema sp.]